MNSVKISIFRTHQVGQWSWKMEWHSTKKNWYKYWSFGLWKLWKRKRKCRWSQSFQVLNLNWIISSYLKKCSYKNSSSFPLEKISTYPDGPELPVIGFDSLMNLTNLDNSAFVSEKQFFKETLVKSGINEFWPRKSCDSSPYPCEVSLL